MPSVADVMEAHEDGSSEPGHEQGEPDTADVDGAVDDLASALGVTVKNRALAREAVKSLLMQTLADMDDEEAESETRPSLAQVLGTNPGRREYD